MIILIAESKTMEKTEHEISSECYDSHRPFGEEEAAEIMAHIRDMAVSDLAAAIKISVDMAARLRQMAYEFPNKSMGMKAICAFTGVVFRNLDYNSLSKDDQEWAQQNVRLISSLYGWLRPEDIIKPYRLDYTSPLAPDGSPLFSFWKSDVTRQLLQALRSTGESDILDLLPADAAKCFDWKEIKKFAKVWKVDFKEHNGNSVRSPHATRLKALRGELLRSIIINRLSSPEQVATFSSDSLLPAIADESHLTLSDTGGGNKTSQDRILFYV